MGATVITAAEIRQSGAANVNQAIRSVAGVYGRQNSYGSSDASLDLRGFGGAADQNVVILVDGVRLSENESATALLSTIPIETVERIEIVRGGSSVLYGDGATGGTIQVFTKRPARNSARGSIAADIGSDGQRGLRLALARDWDGLGLDVNAANNVTDNFRDNNRWRGQTLGAGLQWAGDGSRIGVRIDSTDQHYRTAGALTMAQYQANPRSSFTPDDTGSNKVERVTLSGEQRIGAFELAAELSQREKTTRSHTVGFYGVSDYATFSRTTQFSPRMRHTADFGTLHNELVAGFDFLRSSRDPADDAGAAGGIASGAQRSRAVYARDEIQYGAARLALGARAENFNQSSSAIPTTYAATNYSQSQTVHAWDAVGSYALTPATTVFAKTGRSFRVANVDDNGYTLTPGQLLAPQTSHDLELGGIFGSAGSIGNQLTATLFQHNLRNEIMYDPTILNPGSGFNGANVNLDPTRRRGVELALRAQLNDAWALHATLQHVDARFTEGPNAGHEIVLVPRNTASARLNWEAGRQSAMAGVFWAASQRYGDDFTNTCAARIASYVTLDARYALRLGQWELALAGTNLGNRNYFNQAYGCQSGIYPAAGRQLDFTARYDF